MIAIWTKNGNRTLTAELKRDGLILEIKQGLDGQARIAGPYIVLDKNDMREMRDLLSLHLSHLEDAFYVHDTMPVYVHDPMPVEAAVDVES